MSYLQKLQKHYTLNSDTHDDILRKNLLVLSTIVMAIIVIPWSALYFVLDNPIAAYSPLAYSLLSLLGLLHFFSTKKIAPLRYSQLLLCLVLPFMVSLSLGGFRPSSAVIIWGFTSPMGAFLFGTRRQALFLFISTIALIVLTAVLEFYQPLIPGIKPLPEGVIIAFYVLNIGTVLSLVFFFFSFAEKQKSELLRKIGDEQLKSATLLQNILPKDVINELESTGHVEPALHDEVTILFTDFANFTETTSTMPGNRMVTELNEIFAAFDEIATEEGIEKIKTIGDAYMAAAGLASGQEDHAVRCTKAALRMLAYVEQRNRISAFKWKLRIGIHSGSVVSGVVGKYKYTYDIWGDSVNIASRMESSGEAQKVNVSAYTYDKIREFFNCTYRGKIGAKGKGEIDMYFVDGLLTASKNTP